VRWKTVPYSGVGSCERSVAKRCCVSASRQFHYSRQRSVTIPYVVHSTIGHHSNSGASCFPYKSRLFLLCGGTVAQSDFCFGLGTTPLPFPFLPFLSSLFLSFLIPTHSYYPLLGPYPFYPVREYDCDCE